MKELLIIAWRNIWRNKKRTFITTGSIFFAVFFAVVMRSMQLGSYSHMINQSIEKYLGYLQIQNVEYFDNPILDNYLEYNQEVINGLNETEGIKIAAPRIETFVLASTGHQSKGVMLTGIDPIKEASLSNPEHNLVHYKLTPEVVDTILNQVQFDKEQSKLLRFNNRKQYNNLDRLAAELALKPQEFAPYHSLFKKYTSVPGAYLKPNDDGVLISSKLATFLNANVGDTIILMGQGLFGATAAGEFPVRGIVSLPSPELDNKVVYAALSTVQNFLSMPGKLTSISINLVDNDDMKGIQDKLNAHINNSEIVVKNWIELNPVLYQQIEGDNKSGQVFIVILYLIVFFGIIGTVLMMMAERKREFGVLVAIGMRKTKLFFVVFFEMIFMALMGAILGMLASIPLILTFYYHPIRLTGEIAKMYEDMGFDPLMPTEPIDDYFYFQVVIVLIMVIVACYIPLKKIFRLKVMKALRS